MLTCSKCGQSVEAFKRGRQCEECVRAYRRKHYEANREEYIERARVWSEANPAKTAAAKTRWRQENRDYFKARHEANREAELERMRRQWDDPVWAADQLAKQRRWRERNADRVAATQAAYRAANREELNARQKEYVAANRDKVRAYFRGYSAARRAGDPVTDEARAYVAVLRADPCSYCGNEACEIDHIVPVIRGGDGSWENFTAACRSCNASKHKRSLLHYLAAA